MHGFRPKLVRQTFYKISDKIMRSIWLKWGGQQSSTTHYNKPYKLWPVRTVCIFDYLTKKPKTIEVPQRLHSQHTWRLSAVWKTDGSLDCMWEAQFFFFLIKLEEISSRSSIFPYLPTMCCSLSTHTHTPNYNSVPRKLHIGHQKVYVAW